MLHSTLETVEKILNLFCYSTEIFSIALGLPHLVIGVNSIKNNGAMKIGLGLALILFGLAFPMMVNWLIEHYGAPVEGFS